MRDTFPASDRPAYDPSDDLQALKELWLEKLMPFWGSRIQRSSRRAPPESLQLELKIQGFWRKSR
jgi:hypothetical protein